MRRFKFEDGQLVNFDDAAVSVYLETISADVVKGKKGSPRECVISNNGGRQHNQFPHKVHAVETHKSRCMVVDRLKKDGSFAHAVRYILDPKMSKKIRRFDKTGVWVLGTVTLYAPTKGNKKGVTHIADPTKRTGKPPKKRQRSLNRQQLALIGL